MTRAEKNNMWKPIASCIQRYLNIRIFLTSFVIGLFVTYVLDQQQRIVIVYPSPENIQSYLFKDDANSCFRYKQEEVDCAKNESLLSNILPQQTEKLS